MTSPASIPEQIPLNLFPPPQASLDNFVAGPNAAVLAALVAARSGTGAEFIHIWGSTGSGRSHLLQAMSGQTGSAQVPVYRPDQAVYTVDDVHRLPESGQAQLFDLQNTIREERGLGRPAVLVTSADRPPSALSLREDVRTRLGWGLVFALHPITDADLTKALQTYAHLRGLPLSDEVTTYMLTRLPRDIRGLLGVLDGVDRYALAKGRALTVPILRQWIQSRSENSDS